MATLSLISCVESGPRSSIEGWVKRISPQPDVEAITSHVEYLRPGHEIFDESADSSDSGSTSMDDSAQTGTKKRKRTARDSSVNSTRSSKITHVTQLHALTPSADFKPIDCNELPTQAARDLYARIEEANDMDGGIMPSCIKEMYKEHFKNLWLPDRWFYKQGSRDSANSDLLFAKSQRAKAESWANARREQGLQVKLEETVEAQHMETAQKVFENCTLFNSYIPSTNTDTFRPIYECIHSLAFPASSTLEALGCNTTGINPKWLPVVKRANENGEDMPVSGKKVDFVFRSRLSPKQRSNALTAINGTTDSDVNRSINHTIRDSNLEAHPIGVSLEEKFDDSQGEAIIQLAIWTLAYFNRLTALFGKDVNLPVMLSMIIQREAYYLLYFHFNNVTQKATIFGHQYVGAVNKPVESYKVLENLSSIEDYVAREFLPLYSSILDPAEQSLEANDAQQASGAHAEGSSSAQNTEEIPVPTSAISPAPTTSLTPPSAQANRRNPPRQKKNMPEKA